MATRDLLVRVLGDTRDVENAFARSSRAATQFGASVDTTGKKADKAARNLRGFATGAAAGFGGALVFNEVTQQLRASIDVASNLAEQISKTSVVFGESADEVRAWSRATASSIGIASDQALAAASTFGAMFDQAGRAGDDAAALSKQVVELAADLASFNNTSVDDALTALRSGLSGEIEPLRRFQVFLTEAAVAAEAMAASGKKSAQELTQGEKIMARWSIILRQTTKQQGDFARTSEGLANQQRILSAQVRDLQANLGNLLLPVITDLAEGLVLATSGALDLADALRKLGEVEIPVINVPVNIDLQPGGGEFRVGDILKKAPVAAISPALLAGLVVKDIVESFRDGPAPNTKAAADAFDAKFDTFLESLEKDIDKSTKRANAKLKAFGQAGFKPLDTNELGETLQRQFEGVIDALDLRFDQAQFAGNTQAALAVLDKTESVIRQRIASQGRTTDLMRQLFRVEQERAAVLREGREAARAAAEQARELAREQAEAAREALAALTQRNQFKAIGLSGTGGAIIPTVDNLQKQLDQLTNRLGGDITPKLAAQLKNVGKVLAGQFGKVTERTREAIRDLFRTIRSEFDKGTKEGPLTKTTSLNEDKLLAGLGLSRDLEKELRARLSSFNSAGVALAGANRPTGTGFVGGPITGRTVVVENHNTVTLDGDVVGRNVTRSQQKNRRRNPKQKRGPNSGV